MKNINFDFKFNKLDRAQMKMIVGSSEASAKCGGGSTVTCSGISCSATDNSHCQCTQSNGTLERKDCPIA
jgi:hypothetical protein